MTAPYKYPRSLRFVDALPRTLTGKLRRGVIRPPLADSATIPHGRSDPPEKR